MYKLDAVYATGCLTPLLNLISNYWVILHTDVQTAGMDLVLQLLTMADTRDPNVTLWIAQLSSLVESSDKKLVDQALAAYANLTVRFARTGSDTGPLADPCILEHLLRRLRIAGDVPADATGGLVVRLWNYYFLFWAYSFAFSRPIFRRHFVSLLFVGRGGR